MRSDPLNDMSSTSKQNSRISLFKATQGSLTNASVLNFSHVSSIQDPGMSRGAGSISLQKSPTNSSVGSDQISFQSPT